MYNITTIYIILMEVFLTLTLFKILTLSQNKRQSSKAMLIFGFWLLSVIGLFQVTHILPSDISSVSLFIIILLGVTASTGIFYLLKDQFLGLSQDLLLLPQGFRMMFGAGFLIEGAYGIIPIHYGVLDGVLHITTAFLALSLAIYIARGCSCKNSIILVNIFGLTDIVIVAAGISFIILPEIGSHHNVFLAVFYAAPIFICLHLISLYTVFTEKSSL